eukprot:TRINITY_DN19793_c0_g1_i1.p1 TRINITY_DN19793_c0_g1~~TRINITY_DN19793_c0_g1_i1.p1  ORF type:complete len:800 (-),score=116.76 TRINITY_DN19793_c0_g1_i1:4-2403(-)
MQNQIWAMEQEQAAQIAALLHGDTHAPSHSRETPSSSTSELTAAPIPEPEQAVTVARSRVSWDERSILETEGMGLSSSFDRQNIGEISRSNIDGWMDGLHESLNQSEQHRTGAAALVAVDTQLWQRLMSIMSTFDHEGCGYGDLEEVKHFLLNMQDDTIRAEDVHDVLSLCNVDPCLGIRIREVVDNLVRVLQGSKSRRRRRVWQTLEKASRFGESVMWTLMERWYERSGTEAWGELGAVPCYITSNQFICKQYASLVAGLVRDLKSMSARVPGDKRSEYAALDLSEPVYIVEVAGGHGKFTHLMLRALRKERYLKKIKVCMVLTDFSESTIEQLRSKPELRRWVDRGLLDFAVFDVGNTVQLELLEAGRSIGPGCEAVNPLVMIGNYAFDTFKSDNFRVKGGDLLQGLSTVKVQSSYEDPLDDPAALSHCQCKFSYEPCGSSSEEYYTTERPPVRHESPFIKAGLTEICNQLLHRYQGIFGSPGKMGTFLIPTGALQCVLSLMRMTRGGRLMCITGDKGNTVASDFEGKDDPHIDIHGSFSTMVNFHAIGLAFRMLGGFALHPSKWEASLKVAHVRTGATGVQVNVFTNCGPSSHGFIDLLRSFDTFSKGFNPDDYDDLEQTWEKELERGSGPDLGQALALLHLSQSDSDVLREFHSVFCKQLPTVPRCQAKRVLDAIPGVLDASYSMSPWEDSLFEVARLHQIDGNFNKAIDLYNLSIEAHGSHASTQYNLALCYRKAGDAAKAMFCLHRAIVQNPKHENAMRWLKRMLREEKEQSDDAKSERASSGPRHRGAMLIP